MTTGERMKERRKDIGLSAEQVAEALGVSPATIYRYENGDIEKVPGSHLPTLAKILHTTAPYLMGWTDNPYMEIVSVPRKAIRIPVLGSVAAGIPIEAVEDILDYEEITPELAATGDFFALRIKGSSMEPRMLDGDVVIVRQQEDAQSGDIAVVLVNGDEATVKKIRKQPDGLSLVPMNPIFDIMFYTADQCRSLPVRIIGKVVELRGKL